MDLIDQLRALAAHISNTKDLLQTEEATKNAMIMPFIQALGYNVFDPTEVTPELVADIGIKKGEKVDYAILKDGKPIMLFECKKCGCDLNINHASQLLRYFNVTEARFGILTNGISYLFFTDIEKQNKMDENPFLDFNILDFKEQDVEELKKFTKISFDVDTILMTANEMKYTRYIQGIISEIMTNPSEDFVRLVSSDLMVGKRFTPSVIEQFTQITKRAFRQLLSDRINERLKVAMTPDPLPEGENPTNKETPLNDKNTLSLLETTQEEIEGFHIVRSILRDVVASRRIFMRDSQSYCAILLDDNNRKTICRLRFNNGSRLVLGLMKDKNEEKVTISDLDEIYNFADALKKTAASYQNATSGDF